MSEVHSIGNFRTSVQRRKDYSGQRFGSITAMRLSHVAKSKTFWFVLCGCGKEFTARIDQVVSGATSDCGCSRPPKKPKIETAKRLPPMQLAGRRFSRLMVVAEAERGITARKTIRRWTCRCDCGVEVTVAQRTLVCGDVQSCGCLQREKAAITGKVTGERNARHGMVQSPEWLAWRGLRARCENETHPSYRRYGGRGIRFCDRWKTFENFLADMGLRPGKQYSIGRIDNDGDYCPENCRWETPTQQNRNRSTNLFVTCRGVTKTLAEWCGESGVRISCVSKRLKMGIPPELAIFTPSAKTIGGRANFNNLMAENGVVTNARD